MAFRIEHIKIGNRKFKRKGASTTGGSLLKFSLINFVSHMGSL